MKNADWRVRPDVSRCEEGEIGGGGRRGDWGTIMGAGGGGCKALSEGCGVRFSIEQYMDDAELLLQQALVRMMFCIEMLFTSCSLFMTHTALPLLLRLLAPWVKATWFISSGPVSECVSKTT